MAYTATKNNSGLYEIYNNGQRIATGSAAILPNYGLSEAVAGGAPTPASVPVSNPGAASASPIPGVQTFQYVKKDGTLGTISAVNSNAALASLPADASPNTGVSAVGSVNSLGSNTPVINTSSPSTGAGFTPITLYSNPSIDSQTKGTVASPFPNLGGFQSSPNQIQWLPQPSGSGTGGSLLDFANALDQAVNLARQKRNSLGLGLMSGYQGTLAASDFNGILGNLNAASDTTSQNLIDRAIKAATPTYQTQQIGDQLVQLAYDSSGKFIGSTPIAVLPQKYQYDTMTLPNGDVYYIQKDSTGKPIGQQLVYQSENNSKNTYKYETDYKGNLYEYNYAPNGQLQNLQIVGNLPQEASAQDYVYKSTYEDGAGVQYFVGVKQDGTVDNIKLSGTGKSAAAGGGTGQSNQIIDNERALLTSFKNEPIVKDYNTILQKKLSVEKIVSSGVGGPGDLALVYEFMKGLDPTSVVRESEYAAAAKSGNIFLGIYAQFNGYLKEQGGFLPPQVQKAFTSIVDSKFQVQTELYNNLADQYKTIASNQGLNPNNVVIDYANAAPPSTAVSKGNMNDSQFVEKALSSQGASYNYVISMTPPGQIAVLKNSDGEVGYIPAEEFNSQIYTRL